jgi:hypothetical protein
MQLAPRDMTSTLSDAEIRFALRSMLHSTNPLTQYQCGVCHCGQPSHPSHFLVCTRDQHLRTIRHTVVCSIIADAAKKVMSNVTREKEVGSRVHVPTGGIRSIIADIVTLDGNVKSIIDVGITSSFQSGSTHPDWPSRRVVSESLASEEELLDLAERLPWKSHAHPNVNVRVTQHYRRKAIDATIGVEIRRMSSLKIKKYAEGGVVVNPVILSALGFVGDEAQVFFDKLGKSFCPNDPAEQSSFRLGLLGRLSVSLLRYANRLHNRHARSAFHS